MNNARYQFGNVVVVENDFIGVIVKSWDCSDGTFSHEVYVRAYNKIKEYQESEIKHYIYSKELSEEEKDFY
jgi:hypothetical protein